LIVLAIAGLILLIVFLAVPALQRNSRNTARNNEAARISAAVTECLANRNGQTGSCDDTTEIAVNPATDLQQFTSVSFGGAANTATTVNARINFNDKCSTDGAAGGAAGATARDFTVTYQREPALTRCIGSQ
jgi:hypothetical protein